MSLDKQREAFIASVDAEASYIVVTGELIHDLAKSTNLAKSDREEAKAVSRTLPMVGKGRGKVTVSLGVAKFLVEVAPQTAHVSAPVPTPVDDPDAGKKSKGK